MHTHIHAYMHTCIHACMHACMYIHTHIHTHTHTYIRTCIQCFICDEVCEPCLGLSPVRATLLNKQTLSLNLFTSHKRIALSISWQKTHSRHKEAPEGRVEKSPAWCLRRPLPSMNSRQLGASTCRHSHYLLPYHAPSMVKDDSHQALCCHQKCSWQATQHVVFQPSACLS